MFWTCFGGIVLEHRAQDGTINGFDNKQQFRGDGSTYHHMIQSLEYSINFQFSFDIAVTGARVKTVRKMLFLALLGSHVFRTHTVALPDNR